MRLVLMIAVVTVAVATTPVDGAGKTIITGYGSYVLGTTLQEVLKADPGLQITKSPLALAVAFQGVPAAVYTGGNPHAHW